MKEDRRKVFVALSFVSFVSSTLVGCLVLGFLAGQWVDERFDVYPAGRAGGLFLSVLLAARGIFLQLRDNFLRDGKRGGQ